MKKKFLYILTALVMALSLAMFAACSDDPAPEPKPTPDDNPPAAIETTVTMDPSLSMSLFENACVTAVTNSDEAVKYSSSDTSVLTVDENTGIITPLKAGTATVTASVENKTATCSVTVVAPDANGFTFLAVNRSVTLKKAQNTALEIKAFAGDKRLSGISLSFESDKTNIVTVSDAGVLTAIAKGSATVTVSGTYRGVSLGTDTIEVDVIQNVTVSISASETTLYTRAGEDNLPTEADLTIVTNVDGEDVTVQPDEITVTSSDEAVVKYEGGKLVAKGKKGEATVRVDYTTPEGTAAHDTLDIKALYPTEQKTVTDPIIAGKNRGMIYTPDFTAVSGDKAYIGANEHAVTLDEKTGDILVDINGVSASETAVSVKIYADSADTTYEITVPVKVYDFLIGDATEFNAFANALNGNAYIYARLTANVDMKGKTVSTANNPADCSGDDIVTSFMLDGNGYTVYNLSAEGKRGAFASNVGKNAADKNSVIKNVAFEKFNAINAGAGGLFTTVANVSFENFYLSASVNFNWGATIAIWDQGNVTYENCVVYCYEVADPHRTQTGFGRTIGALTSEGQFNTEKNYTDTYAINAYAQKMIRGSGHKDGDDEIEDEPTKFTEGLYESWAAFKEDITAVPQSFNQDIWKINSNGELVFKTATEKQPIVLNSDNITSGQVTLTSNKGHGSAAVKTSGPNGEEGNYLYYNNTGWSGVKWTFNTPIDYSDGMIAITVKVYSSANTDISFFSEKANGTWNDAAVADVLYISLSAQSWKEITLVIDGYVDNGQIKGFQIVTGAAAEIYISEISIFAFATA